MQDDTAADLDADLLLRLSAHWLLKNPDPGAFLDHLSAHGAALFADAISDDPAVVAAAPAHKVLRSDAPGFFRSMGWNILRSMPLPALGWKPHRLQPPGRNEPCLCGFGAKYKHCCQRLMEQAPRLDPIYLGAVVIQVMPASEWAALPGSGVHPDMVAAAAHALHEGGDSRRALRLLEPWGKLPAPWPAARLELLDLLADRYLELGHPRKRKALAEQMVQRGDTVVQSLGWQRLSMIASDRGDTAAARHAFERAQRLTPDEPRVALLEVTTLSGSGDLDRTPRADHSFEWLQAMVAVLNPSDNQGLRDRLGAVLLRRGDTAGALALAERFPDDFVGMELVRTRALLALLALQRLPEAEAALAGALRANAHVLPLLRKARAPERPDVDSLGLGSPEQAAIVVAEQHDLWRDKALQVWLKRLADGGPGESPQLTLT